ncbi:MAG TPA: hypothetical protein VGY91_04830, partial [Chthoniobacterales bacterium]|nr:hypothetical protein [Chthoniobacterales bacterium]
VFLKTSPLGGLPIFLKVNHQLESRTRENRPFGSEGGAKLPSSLPLSINRRTSAKMALLSGQLGDLPLPWVTNRADLSQSLHKSQSRRYL